MSSNLVLNFLKTLGIHCAVKKIINFPRYYITDQGDIISLARKRPRILRLSTGKPGYLRTTLYNDNGHKFFHVHDLVAAHFIGAKPSGYVVNHKDAVKTNNGVNNLEYVTQGDNIKHAIKMGKFHFLKSEESGRAKLTVDQVNFIRKLATKSKADIMAAFFEVHPATIRRIIKGRTWGNIR